MDPNRSRLIVDSLAVVTILASVCAIFWSGASLVAVAVLVAIPWIASTLALVGGRFVSAYESKNGRCGSPVAGLTSGRRLRS